MPLPDALKLMGYWRSHPPVHELLAMLARAYTTWEPADAAPMTEEQHRASLEARWRSGQAISPQQLFEMWSGGSDAGSAAPDPANFPGIGPFPGTKPTIH